MLSLLNGLVLAGGKSSRMGIDKAFIKWHGVEQCYHLAAILKNSCSRVFISCNNKQESIIDNSYSQIVDRYEDAGPMGGLLSAFETDPSCAWLVVACDHPLLDASTIQYLVEHRDEAGIAIAFCNAEGRPEPLIAIWEPVAYEILKKNFSEGQLSPQKLLLKNNAKLMIPPNTNVLLNVNTKDEMKQLLSSKNLNLP